MATGSVKWFNGRRASASSPRTVGAPTFSCISNTMSGTGYRNLEEGQKVKVETNQGPKGLQAANVRAIG